MAKKTTALAGPAELLDVDPASLAVEDQVRFDATPDDELVASVKRFGVLQPPTVYYDADRDAHVVVIGHRRVGAAIAAGAKSITVLVRPAEAAKDALRTEQQIVENERRKGITPGELAAGFKRLHLFGLTPQDIAAQVGEKPDRVKSALAATESAYGQSALDKGVDLEQAAIIAEFDDDPDTQAELTSVALTRPESFRSRVAQVQAARATDARIAKLQADAEREGVKVVDVKHYDDRYWSGTSESGWRGRQLTRLDIRPEEHTGCPGHAVIINAASWADGARLDYVCTDYQGNGHEVPEHTLRELTEEEIAEREEREAARAAEEQRRQAFQANTTARREWLRGFLGGRLNQTAGIFDLIADATIGLAMLDDAEPWTAAGVALQLLTGSEGSTISQEIPLAEAIVNGEVTPLRALAAYALGLCDSCAESPFAAQNAPRLTAAYLDRLQSWKYPLTDLDKEILTAAHEAAGAFDAAVDAADADADDEPEAD